MMLLYFGSNAAVPKPGMTVLSRTLDYGPGFYATSDREQAEYFARKVSVKRGGSPVVSVYEFDDGLLGQFTVMRFDGSDIGWLRFVVGNRSGEDVGARPDMIIGPVANDDVYGTIVLLEGGAITEDAAIRSLKVKKLSDQYVFTNDAVVGNLVFREAFELGE